MIEDHDLPPTPDIDDDADVLRLQSMLGRYGAVARGLGEWKPRVVVPLRRRRRLARIVAAGLAAGVLLVAGHFHRLAWSEGRAWQVTHEDGGVRAGKDSIAPGQMLATDARQSLTIAVARIGRITLSPQSSMRLLETRSGRHRVTLDSGHLRARIWAPPESFGVTDGTTEVIDLGCDFDLWKDADGSGRIFVRSGWIAWRAGAREILLPAGFGLRFDSLHASTPVRPLASAAFASAVEALEEALAQSGQESSAAIAAAIAVAAHADDADAFTLLSLLSQHSQLAHGALYGRLARALGSSGDDESHRTAWAAGDHAAIDAWWQRMPTQPKAWWANWKDVLF